jgi:cephalosporin-C deacetylase
MPSIDMPLEQLRLYKPTLYREADFESFWESTIEAVKNQPLNAELIPYDLPARGLECYAVRFDGFKGGRLAGWYVRPDSRGKFPGLVMYHGYSMRGARPLDMVHYAAQGICVLSLDCRGQNGQSQDANVYPEGHATGWMTAGIRDPEQYYYRYVYADALRALELLAHRDEVDPKRIAITGASQGGGLSLAVSALSDRPILSMPDIPFLCDFRRAIQTAPAAISGGRDVSQSLPTLVRAGHSHAQLFRLSEPGPVDSQPDDYFQWPMRRKLPAEHDLRRLSPHHRRKADGDLSVS